MHWWDRTKNLWHRTDDPEKAPQTLNYHQNCPCSSGVIFSPVRSQWFANGIRHANKNPFKLWRGDFFEGHELDSFQSMHGCGPPDISKPRWATTPIWTFFSFRNGSLHVTQQTDSSFVRLHDLVLSHSEWHSGDARRWVVFKELHYIFAWLRPHCTCLGALLSGGHAYHAYLPNVGKCYHRSAQGIVRITETSSFPCFSLSPKSESLSAPKKLCKCNTNDEISKVFVGSTCPLVHDRLKKLFHLSMWQQGGCWTSVLLWSPNPYGSIMTSLEWSKPWLWSKRNQTHKIQVANLVRWVILEGDRNPRCLQRGHSKLIPKWIAKTPEPNMNLVHPQTN